MPAGGSAAALLLSLALIFRDVDVPATDLFDLPYSVRVPLSPTCAEFRRHSCQLPQSGPCFAMLHAALAAVLAFPHLLRMASISIASTNTVRRPWHL